MGVRGTFGTSGPRDPRNDESPASGGLGSTATGIRTPVSAVRGRRPSPLDDGGSGATKIATADQAAVGLVRRPRCEHAFVSHPADLRQRATDLRRAGQPDSAVAAELGIPRSTVRDWRLAPPAPAPSVACHRCWGRARPVTFSAPDYAEALGLYLGDGHILRVGRSYRLRVSLDVRYPMIVAETEALLGGCSSRTVADESSETAARRRSSPSITGTCHASSRSTDPDEARAIDRLEPWQHTLRQAAPWRSCAGASARTAALREPDRAIQLRQLRLLQPVDRHPRPLRGHLFGGRRRLPPLRAPHPRVPPGECRPAPRPRRA